MSATATAVVALPVAQGGGAIGLAGAAVGAAIAVVAVAGVVVAATAMSGLSAMGAGIREAAEDARQAKGRAVGSRSKLDSREFDLNPLVADLLLKQELPGSGDWKRDGVTCTRAGGSVERLDVALLRGGRLLFGIGRRGSKLLAVVQGDEGQQALDQAYREAVMTLTDRRMREQGFQCVENRAAGSRRTRTYTRGSEKYQFIEDLPTRTITINALGVFSNGDVKAGAACPTWNPLADLAPAAALKALGAADVRRRPPNDGGDAPGRGLAVRARMQHGLR
ncbi:MAG: hypothetical protein ACYDAG_04795 [Chloroflexota bacterium]